MLYVYIGTSNSQDTSNTKSNGIPLEKSDSSSNEDLFTLSTKQRRSKDLPTEESTVDNTQSSLFSTDKDNLSSDNESDTLFTQNEQKSKAKLTKSQEGNNSSKIKKAPKVLSNATNKVLTEDVTENVKKFDFNEEEFTTKLDDNNNFIDTDIPSSHLFDTKDTKEDKKVTAGKSQVKLSYDMFNDLSDSDSAEDLFTASTSKFSKSSNTSKDSITNSVSKTSNPVKDKISTDHSKSGQATIIKKDVKFSSSTENTSASLFDPIDNGLEDETSAQTVKDKFDIISNPSLFPQIDFEFDLPTANSPQILSSDTKSRPKNNEKRPPTRGITHQSSNSVLDSIFNQPEMIETNKQIENIEAPISNSPLNNISFIGQLNQTIGKNIPSKSYIPSTHTQPHKEVKNVHAASNGDIDPVEKNSLTPNLNKIRPKNPNRRPQTRSARVKIANSSNTDIDVFFNEVDSDVNPTLHEPLPQLDIPNGTIKSDINHLPNHESKKKAPANSDNTTAEQRVHKNPQKTDTALPANHPNFMLDIPDDLFASVHLPPASSKRTTPKIVSTIEPSTTDSKPISNAEIPSLEPLSNTNSSLNIDNNEISKLKVNSKILKRTDDELFGADDLFDTSALPKVPSEKIKKKKVKGTNSKTNKKNKEFNPSSIDDIFS